jgi:hypothetical protein
MGEERWIDEQKKNHMFGGAGQTKDADRMLEYEKTNRVTYARQSKLVIGVRLMADCTGNKCLNELADYVELAQMNIEAESRKNFMKVAIEQWQGKLANLKHKTIDILT